MASSVKQALVVLPSLEVVVPGMAWNGFVVGLVEAREAGGLAFLKEVDYTSASEYAVGPEAVLLLVAWLKQQYTNSNQGSRLFVVSNLVVCMQVVKDGVEGMGLPSSVIRRLMSVQERRAR